jgi:signal transduction histidine kinase
MSIELIRKAAFVAALLAIALPAMASERGTPDEAQALLAKAVKAVQQDEAKAIAAFNDPKGGYQDRDLYVFCAGPDGKTTAHRDPKMLGGETAAIKTPDGRMVGKEIAALGEKGGGTLEYPWPNPLTGKVETKVSYIKKAGSHICGVGAYKQ